MTRDYNRRNFLKTAAASALAVPAIKSLEEYALVARAAEAPPAAPAPAAAAANALPNGTIGDLKMSRIICGGNLISGYAHSRDLIYVSSLLKVYFTEEKIMETWAKCEAQGINTMIFNPGDKHGLMCFSKYRNQGGKIQCLAQLDANPEDPHTSVKEAVDFGAHGVTLVGNLGDKWTRENKMESVAKFLEAAKLEGVIGGVAGHELRTAMSVEQAGLKPDFYMKTLHDTNYWSTRRPDQEKEVIDNYATDNYWCMDPKATIEFMKTCTRPWLAYKVLAAGAIRPRHGFEHAFKNGADFCVVGMFDFQIVENAGIARDVLAALTGRERPWRA